MKKEIWKTIPSYEGLYEVSNFGNVKTLSDRYGKERLLTPSINTTGYYRINLFKNNKIKNIKVHQLVAMAFLGHTPNGYEIVVNHKDNNPLNNYVDNLELVSNRYNTTCHKEDVGVTWDKTKNKWVSRIRINGKNIFLGLFIDKKHGSSIYQKALTNIHLYDGDNKKFKELIHG